MGLIAKVLGVVLIFGFAIVALRRKKPYFKRKSQYSRAFTSPFKIVRLLNTQEQRCFETLHRRLKKENMAFWLFPQVSMGEVVKSSSFDGFSVTNSKRFDFLLVDQNFTPIMAVEYNGRGHFKNNYQDRDNVKKIACQKSGLGFFAINYKDSLNDQIDKLIEILRDY